MTAQLDPQPRSWKVVLASRSPRRRELLAHLFPAFDSSAADIDETPRPGETPEAYARRLAHEKALAIRAGLSADERARTLVIGADTAIDRDGLILGKPANENEARDMLRELAGRSHAVLTGFALLPPSGKALVDAAVTVVVFDQVSDEAIAEYVASGLPLDRAGAYGIQDAFGVRYIRKIDGDYYNVMGLPVNAIRRALAELAD